jgi:hypothetical protein
MITSTTAGAARSPALPARVTHEATQEPQVEGEKREEDESHQ